MRYSVPLPGAPLSELDIQAYVDGALDARRVDRVDDYLGQAPDEARRVAFYHRLNAQLQAGFPSLDEAKTSGRVGRLRSMTRWRRRAAILALVLLAGALAGAGLILTAQPGDWLTPTGVMALEDAAATEQTDPAGPASCVAGGGACAVAPDLSRVGFRITGATTAPLRFFLKARETVYRNAAGQPAVLLSVPNWGATSLPQWQARRVGTIRVLSWTQDGWFYALVGKADTQGLMKAADLAVSGRYGNYSGGK